MTSLSSAVTSWSCQRCTLVNSVECSRCRACDFANPLKSKDSSFIKKVSSMINSSFERFDSALGGLVSAYSGPNYSNVVTLADWLCPNCARVNKELSEFCCFCRFNPRKDITHFRWNCERCHLKQMTPPLNFKCPLCKLKCGKILNRDMSKSMPLLDGRDTVRVRDMPFLELKAIAEQHEENSSLYKEIVTFCRNENQIFVDDSFPHSHRSVGTFEKFAKYFDRSRYDSIVWLTPTDIRPANNYDDQQHFGWSIFNDPRPSDISQGALGNCWFIAALAVVAERPDILEKLIINREFNPLGIYEIRLCIDGIWESVIVDSFFPCTKHGHLVFAEARKRQLWVPLLEKAYAKIYGNYTLLTSGSEREGLGTLTGAPTDSISLDIWDKSAEERQSMIDLAWAKLLSAREAVFLISCSCGGRKHGDDPAAYKAVGLSINHSYSILDVRLFDGKKLLLIRNPWGTFVWLGEYGPRWTGWTPELCRRFGFKERPGTFWIPFDAFVEWFSSVEIAKIRTNWTSTRYALDLGCADGRFGMVYLTVTEPSTEITLTLFERGSRTKKDDLDIFLLVHRLDPSTGGPGELYAPAKRTLLSNATLEERFFAPGEYVICGASFGRICSGGGTPQKILAALVIHSSKQVHSRMVSATLDFFQKSIVQFVLAEGEMERGVTQDAVTRYVTRDFLGLLMMVDNYSKTSCVQVYSNCEESTNLLSSRGGLITADSIPPMHRQIILVMTQCESSQPFVVRHSSTQRFTSFAQLRDYAPQQPSIQHYPPPTASPAMLALHTPTPLYCDL